MTPGARLAAASEVLNDILIRKAAADRVLQHWGKSHRFAGSKDRAAIAARVYAVLRRLGECAAVFGNREPRSLVLGSLCVIDRLEPELVAQLAIDGTHALGALSGEEQEAVADYQVHGKAAPVLNSPEWLRDELTAAFGAELEAELAALNERAPFDLRVNVLKATRDSVLAELVALGLPALPCQRSATGIRMPAGTNAKVEGLACFLEGRIEVQDESSQLAVAFAAPRPGDTVIDLAAGAGGKALALAAAMNNQGRVFACDVDAVRLSPLRLRQERSGATIIEPAGDPYADGLRARFPDGADLVFVDAPCSGCGTWRRNPEAKWTLTPETLQRYQDAQFSLLDRAAQLTRPDGRIIYAVCSVLPREGIRQVEAFCSRHDGWEISSQMLLTPARSMTDGFFAAALQRRAL